MTQALVSYMAWVRPPESHKFGFTDLVAGAARMFPPSRISISRGRAQLFTYLKPGDGRTIPAIIVIDASRTSDGFLVTIAMPADRALSSKSMETMVKTIVEAAKTVVEEQRRLAEDLREFGALADIMLGGHSASEIMSWWGGGDELDEDEDCPEEEDSWEEED